MFDRRWRHLGVKRDRSQRTRHLLHILFIPIKRLGPRPLPSNFFSLYCRYNYWPLLYMLVILYPFLSMFLLFFCFFLYLSHHVFKTVHGILFQTQFLRCQDAENVDFPGICYCTLWGKNTAPFYFCSSFVKTFYIEIDLMIRTHMHLNTGTTISKQSAFLEGCLYKTVHAKRRHYCLICLNENIVWTIKILMNDAI